MTEKDTKDCDELHKRVVGTSRLTSMREDIQGPHPIFVALSEAGEIIGYAGGREAGRRTGDGGRRQEGRKSVSNNLIIDMPTGYQ